MSVSAARIDRTAVIATLDTILESELAGVVRCTHYSFMVCGCGRIPIVAWLRGQANESLRHAPEADEMVTALGGHPSLSIEPLLETHRYRVRDVLKESLEHQQEAVDLYEYLPGLVQGRNVMLEASARRQIAAECLHVADEETRLRNAGEHRPAVE